MDPLNAVGLNRFLKKCGRVPECHGVRRGERRVGVEADSATIRDLGGLGGRPGAPPADFGRRRISSIVTPGGHVRRRAGDGMPS